MKILLSCYRFLLFFIVTWTTYNTNLFFDLAFAEGGNIYLKDYLFGLSNIYLLGALDFHKFVSDGISFLKCLFNIKAFTSHTDLFLISLYWLVVNCTALYAWCRRQNPLTACGLTTAAWFAGPYLALVFADGQLWAVGYVATLVFYLLLLVVNVYRRRRYPNLHLPTWLQWQHPDFLPPLEVIGEWVSGIFKKRRKADPETGADAPQGEAGCYSANNMGNTSPGN